MVSKIPSEDIENTKVMIISLYMVILSVKIYILKSESSMFGCPKNVNKKLTPSRHDGIASRGESLNNIELIFL